MAQGNFTYFSCWFFAPSSSPPASDSDQTTFPQGRVYQETKLLLIKYWAKVLADAESRTRASRDCWWLVIGELVVVYKSDCRIGLAWWGDSEVMLATRPYRMWLCIMQFDWNMKKTSSSTGGLEEDHREWRGTIILSKFLVVCSLILYYEIDWASCLSLLRVIVMESRIHKLMPTNVFPSSWVTIFAKDSPTCSPGTGSFSQPWVWPSPGPLSDWLTSVRCPNAW